jgi:hypothetical protein
LIIAQRGGIIWGKNDVVLLKKKGLENESFVYAIILI